MKLWMKLIRLFQKEKIIIKIYTEKEIILEIKISNLTKNENEFEEKINIMTLGNTTVGKTCFILKFTENRFQETYIATIGLDFKMKTIQIKEKKYKIFFYDTTGQERYKSIALNTIKNANGILLMYDITNEESFKSIPNWIQSVKDVKGNDFPMVLSGNKIDKKDERKISKKQGEELAANYNMEFFEISNKDGTNVEECGLALANKILEKRKKDGIDIENINKSNNTTKLRNVKNNKKDKSRRCC